jgi:hypothetical protein
MHNTQNTSTVHINHQHLAYRRADAEARALYGPPAEWFVDDDSPRHLGAGLSWINTTGAP